MKVEDAYLMREAFCRFADGGVYLVILLAHFKLILLKRRPLMRGNRKPPRHPILFHNKFKVSEHKSASFKINGEVFRAVAVIHIIDIVPDHNLAFEITVCGLLNVYDLKKEIPH